VFHDSEFMLSEVFAFSADFLIENRPQAGKDMTYDIDIDVSQQVSYMDFEVQFDFLTANIEMVLYRDGERLGRSKWVHEKDSIGEFDDYDTRLINRLRVEFDEEE